MPLQYYAINGTKGKIVVNVVVTPDHKMRNFSQDFAQVRQVPIESVDITKSISKIFMEFFLFQSSHLAIIRSAKFYHSVGETRAQIDLISQMEHQIDYEK
jgi:hypothetical protein